MGYPPWFVMGLGVAVPVFLSTLSLLFSVKSPLFWFVYPVMTFPCWLSSGQIRRFTASELSELMDDRSPLYDDLVKMNPRLQEWYLMETEFPPFILRKVTQFWKKRQR